MGIRRNCYYEMAVALVSCKNSVKLLYVPAKYKRNVFVNGRVFAAFVCEGTSVCEGEVKGQSKGETRSKE